MVCPAFASAGTCTLVVNVLGLVIVISPGYVSTSFHRHHFTCTALPSGSDATASRGIVSPGRALTCARLRSSTRGSWFAPAYVGVTDHLMRAAKSFCAAGTKSGLGEGARVFGPSGP